MSVRLMQRVKAPFPSFRTPRPSVTSQSRLQEEKAVLSMVWTLSGITSSVRAPQSEKAPSPIVRSEPGREISYSASLL